MAYGSGPLQRYKMRQLYKRNKRLSRQVGNIRKLKKQWAATPDLATGSVFSKGLYGNSWDTATDNQKIARRALKYYGAGDYRSFLSKIIPQGSFSHLGRTLGGMSGIPGMNAVGAFAGDKFSKFVGFGDYGTSTNQIMGGANKGQISVNESDMTGDVYITQTEFVQNISCTSATAGASTFQQLAFPINPGLAVTFPFLSQIAQNYTLYEFEGLLFKFNPTSGENNATSNSLGKVIMATNYDPNAPPYINSVQMENYDYANAAKPSQTIIHGVETANSQQFGNMQYVRTGATGRDKIFSDIGTLYVATEGVPFAAAGSQVLGELWVTYRVKLSRANLYGSLLGNNIASCVLSGASSTLALAASTITRKATNTIDLDIDTTGSATSFRIVFPRNISLGSYCITLWFDSGATVFTNQTFATVATPVNLQFAEPGSVLPTTAPTIVRAPLAVSATTNGRIMGQVYVIVQAPGDLQASFFVVVSAPLTNTTAWKLVCNQISQIPLNSLA